MRFHDLHVHPEAGLAKVLSFAGDLGWSGVCLIFRTLKDMEEAKKQLREFRNLDISFGVKIEPKRASDVRNRVRSLRRKAELILVHGGDTDVNRKACETPGVDVLSHPELGRRDSGVDYVTARAAKENGVALEFNFRQLLLSYGRSRSEYFEKLKSNAKLARKYSTPFVLTSGAVSCWDMRSPSELISFGKLLGFDPKSVKRSLSGEMIRKNRKRLSGKWIRPGVEME